MTWRQRFGCACVPIPAPVEPNPTFGRSNFMPRFFFHLKDGCTVRDEDGMSFDTVEEARREAVRAAREIMADEVRRGSLTLIDRIEIADEGGNPVTAVTFADAIRIRSGKD